MTRVILLLFLFLRSPDSSGACSRASCAAASAPGVARRRAAAVRRPSVKMLPCPVCGTYVVPGKAISVVSGGAPVYFCSEKCRAEYQPR